MGHGPTLHTAMLECAAAVWQAQREPHEALFGGIIAPERRWSWITLPNHCQVVLALDL